MNRCKQTMYLLLAICLLVTAGCGKSPADQAMQELYDITLEAKGLEESGDMAKGMELLGRMMEPMQKLEAEMKKMSKEEQEAFMKRWEEKFKAAGLDSAPGG